KAAGWWVRHALEAWNTQQSGADHLLIGETPFVGNRFVELAQRLDDGAEAFLAARSCRFVITVPSRAVRRHLEALRERPPISPLHPREREDAPPRVLRELWADLAAMARQLGIVGSEPDGDRSAGYEPDVYRRVYERILRHRTVEVIALDVILPT